MEKRTKVVILFVLSLFFLLILMQQDGDYRIIDVKDGNTVVLECGTTVKLIGVSSTEESLDFLRNNYLNEPINLKADHTSPFDPTSIRSGDVVYAYVLGGEDANIHINAQLLKEGKADILTGTFLADSLEAFRQYAKLGGRERDEELTPTPIPVIDYEEDDIILPEPPTDKKKDRKHSAWYTNGNLNLKMLDEACDYLCPYTKQFANSLAGKSPGPFNAGQICEIFDYCFKNWKYVNDPTGAEYVASASESIEGNLAGDCDDFAILMASCIMAIGGDACINTGGGAQGGHAFTEVDIAGIGKSRMLQVMNSRYNSRIANIATRDDGQHLWMNLDWFGSHPGGQYYDCSYYRHAYPCVRGKWSWISLK